MNTGIWGVSLLALVLTLPALLLRQWKSDLLPLLRSAGILLFSALALASLSPLLSFCSSLALDAGVEDAFSVLLRGAGIALLCRLSSSICRECGETSLAEGVELFGKIEILLLCLPLLSEILSLSKALLPGSFGG